MELVPRKCGQCGAPVDAAVGGEVTCKYCGATLTIDEDPGLRRGLTRATRSEDTRAPVTITFVNANGTVLDLLWLDFEGAERSYGRIGVGEHKAFNTFVGHVWSLRQAGSAVEILRWAAHDQVPRHVTVR